MIVEFRISIADLKSIKRDTLEESLQELLIAYKRGYHLLVIPPDIAKWISRNIKLINADRALIERIGREYTQSKFLALSALLKLVVVKEQNTLLKQGDEYLIGLDLIPGARLLQPTVLIVENLENDGEFYTAVFRFCSEHLRYSATMFDLRHGGGTSVKRVGEHLVGQRRIVCIIVDSDLSAPNQTQNGKVAKILKLAEETGWPLINTLCLPVREIDNLVPLHIIDRLPCAKQKANSVDILNRITSQEMKLGIKPEEFYIRFFDLKNGINRNIVTQITDPAVRKWIESKLALANVSEVEGFGDSIIPQTLQSIEASKMLKKHVEKPDWWGLFGKEFARTVWFGIAPKALKVW